MRDRPLRHQSYHKKGRQVPTKGPSSPILLPTVARSGCLGRNTSNRINDIFPLHIGCCKPFEPSCFNNHICSSSNFIFKNNLVHDPSLTAFSSKSPSVSEESFQGPIYIEAFGDEEHQHLLLFYTVIIKPHWSIAVLSLDTSSVLRYNANMRSFQGSA